jgi:hypothetical protein
MRYLLLLWGDEAAELALAADERRAIVDRHIAFSRALRDGGRTVSGEPLGPSRRGRVLRRDGSVTDGPYLETKEQLGGFYLIECGDPDDAADIAARIPASPGLVVEIREIPD